ncbi:hypothetical protein [Prosthecobacter dejongeii]|uniref:Uncharacterized protein n=1 Tax=Prosthecobacter dejongeii TaxID=48465 RepID=A0A7W8DRI9_9BACT|nr:hypothetical protein [Prosthecobacter dejongeii]MBB5039497.1 hypothetical protein [Prosthecobacter dejongeii]
MNAIERISFYEERLQGSHSRWKRAIKEEDYDLAVTTLNNLVERYHLLGLYHWREGNNPTEPFKHAVSMIFEGRSILEKLNPLQASKEHLPYWKTAWIASLINIEHPAVDLEILDGSSKLNAFLSNVVNEKMSIQKWPQHEDSLKPSLLHSLAIKTNRLYTDLLAGRMSAQDGVKLGQELFTQRENDPFFDVSTEGGGGDNKFVATALEPS